MDYDWQKDKENFFRPMKSCKAKILYGNSEKRFLECQKNGFKKHLPALFPCQFFHVCIILSNLTVFLVQFEINLQFAINCKVMFQSPPTRSLSVSVLDIRMRLNHAKILIFFLGSFGT